jgi:hypothetical protein
LLIFAGLFLVCEAVSAFFFQATARVYYRKMGMDFRSIAKGVLERMFLVISMLNGYPQALTFFSAVKLATRLKHKEAQQENEDRFNDYYLIGNMVSVMIAMGYARLWELLV